MAEAFLNIPIGSQDNNANKVNTNNPKRLPKKKFNLILHEGTDSIKFGMTSEEIKSILDIQPELFKKTVVDIYDTEDYYRTCHVYYEMSKNNTLVCCAIEFLKYVDVYLDGVKLMKSLKENIMQLFKDRFEDFEDDGCGGHSLKYGISFFAPKKSVESVYISREGYDIERSKFFNKAFDEYYQNLPKKRDYICLNCKDVVTSENPVVICKKCNIAMIPK